MKTCATPRATWRRFTAGKSLESYLADRQLRRAVERSFEILGEALSQLRKIDEPLATSFTDYRKIIGFRNVLIHGYGTVDDQPTWASSRPTCPL